MPIQICIITDQHHNDHSRSIDHGRRSEKPCETTGLWKRMVGTERVGVCLFGAVHLSAMDQHIRSVGHCLPILFRFHTCVPNTTKFHTRVIPGRIVRNAIGIPNRPTHHALPYHTDSVVAGCSLGHVLLCVEAYSDCAGTSLEDGVRKEGEEGVWGKVLVGDAVL